MNRFYNPFDLTTHWNTTKYYHAGIMDENGSYRNLSYEQLSERIKDIQGHSVKAIQTTQPIEELLFALNNKRDPDIQVSPSSEISEDDVFDLEDSSLVVDMKSSFLGNQDKQ